MTSAVGLGFDVHPSDAERALWLGGMRFDGEAGLAGHSDGDAVCHAIADALLGAAALGDIGQHFPETDPAIEGIAGLRAPRATLSRSCATSRPRPGVVRRDGPLRASGDRAAARRDARGAGRRLAIALERMSVKATRPEGLGLSGDGVGCFALATLR